MQDPSLLPLRPLPHHTHFPSSAWPPPPPPCPSFTIYFSCTGCFGGWKRQGRASTNSSSVTIQETPTFTGTVNGALLIACGQVVWRSSVTAGVLVLIWFYFEGLNNDGKAVKAELEDVGCLSCWNYVKRKVDRAG